MPASAIPHAAPILLDFAADDAEQAILAVATLLRDSQGLLNYPSFTAALLERQKFDPPLLGHMIALPHARTAAVSQIVFAAGRSQKPVDVGGFPLRIFFVFGVPPDRIAEYLALVAALARRFRDLRAVESLLEAPDAQTFRQGLTAP